MTAEAPILPPPYDREAAERGLARWEEEAEAPVVPAHRPVLETIFGNSPYLGGLALREPATLIRLLDEGPDAAFGAALDLLADADPTASRAQFAETLRTAKRRAALAIGLADITGRWPLERITGALSALADAALQAAVAHLLREAHGRGEVRLRWPDDPARGSGLIVLGMGKLGARELNYSSDIDLVVLFEPEAGAYHGENPRAFFVRIARDLVRLMEERTAGGYVFRTDLRLRPDPAATPLAVSVEAALTYYGALGQNWERAAMIKARPVAGDLAAGAAFLAELRPFVWRKNLDFAAIRDVHSIKRQIQAHRGGATIAVAGHNLKLGRGGIREIEFFAQTQQLIWGGRDPALREPATLPALAALTRVGLVPEGTRAELEGAYRFLRRIEHRLQMIDDRQTHTVPAEPQGLARLAAFAGFASVEAFAAELTRQLACVERHYAALFEEAPELGGPGSLVFTGVEDDPDTIATLRQMGYANPSGVAATVRGWHHGRPRATRSARAREILTELMPALLAAFARQREPDQAFARFDAFITQLPAGVQLFSLFQRNPALMDRVAAICGAAPLLADYLARHPPVLDGLLDGAKPDRPVEPALKPLLAEARHLEEAMDVVRRVVHERAFLIGVATLEGALDVDRAGLARARLADAALTALLPRVMRDFAARYGRIAGGGMAVVAMGKLGGREMMAASDLDLIMLYEHAPGVEGAKGGTGRRLTPPEYFGRLAQQFVTAITAPTGEGKLFDVDMRLRPSGNKGPIAVQLAGFARYQAEEAWTWEHMALTRARVIAGPAGLRRRAAEAIRAALVRPHDPARLREDAASLRTRIAKEIPPFSPWDVKYRPGGLLEAEFVCQVLQLVHAARAPEVLAGSTGASLRALAKAGALEADEAARLIAASRLFRTVQGVLRLTVGKPRTAEDIPPPVVEALCRAAATAGLRGTVDLPALGAQMLASARDVRAAFNRHVADLGPVDAGPEA